MADPISYRARRLLLGIGGALLLLVVPLMLLPTVGCATADRALYHPDAKVYTTPRSDGLAFEELAITSADGTPLSAWFIPATTTAAKGTAVHFHGNAQNMTAHYSFVKWLPAAGYNLVVFDYRGYGRSQGQPSRKGTIADGAAVLAYVRERADVAPQSIIVIGQSLGGAIALAALAERWRR
jgi:fermentation-respiration switch protein FrsA (DUF1100 family)